MEDGHRQRMIKALGAVLTAESTLIVLGEIESVIRLRDFVSGRSEGMPLIPHPGV